MTALCLNKAARKMFRGLPIANTKATIIDCPYYFWRTLDQRFRAQMGMSIHDEIVRCRLNWATGMLADDGIPVRSIADQLGMQLSNFSRFIREHTDHSPREYRQRCLQGGCL